MAIATLKVFVSYVVILIIAGPVTVTAARADPGVLRAEDLSALGDIAWVATGFEMPKSSPALPLVSAGDTSPEASILRRLENAGKAAGFKGVIYDNRDRGHSVLPQEWFPRLPHLQFSKELQQKNLDYGLAGQILLPAIVIGNSSTAITKGQAPRSQPRLAMTSGRYAARAYLTYVSNHLYVYPEHRDHDDGGDHFPVNWPYMVISQGSSHSDKPFLRALAMTVAAFSPNTRDRLIETGLVAPTLQMILRQTQPGTYSRESYKTGLAHPVVFSKQRLAPERMVSLAAALTPEDIPPMVKLAVEEEDFGRKAGLVGMPELLFNSPSSIARIWRGPEYSKQMVVSAAETTDPNGRDLSFSWVLLQGDPGRVRITPQGPNGQSAKIKIDWHDTFRASHGKELPTNRVDIGVFAWNGAYESAPAIISISFPGHQKRVYEPRPGKSGMRLVSIDYDAEARKTYFDPMLHWSAPWTDTIRYDTDGQATEWQRRTRDGLLSLSAPDTLTDGRKVDYVFSRSESGRTLAMQVEADD